MQPFQDPTFLPIPEPPPFLYFVNDDGKGKHVPHRRNVSIGLAQSLANGHSYSRICRDQEGLQQLVEEGFDFRPQAGRERYSKVYLHHLDEDEEIQQVKERASSFLRYSSTAYPREAIPKTKSQQRGGPVVHHPTPIRVPLIPSVLQHNSSPTELLASAGRTPPPSRTAFHRNADYQPKSKKLRKSAPIPHLPPIKRLSPISFSLRRKSTGSQISEARPAPTYCHPDQVPQMPLPNGGPLNSHPVHLERKKYHSIAVAENLHQISPRTPQDYSQSSNVKDCNSTENLNLEAKENHNKEKQVQIVQCNLPKVTEDPNPTRYYARTAQRCQYKGVSKGSTSDLSAVTAEEYVGEDSDIVDAKAVRMHKPRKGQIVLRYFRCGKIHD